MKKVLKNNKKLVGIIFIIILILFLFIMYNLFLYNPKGLYTIKYRTKVSNKWSRWAKNGKTSGNMIDSINNIDFKISEKEGKANIEYYADNKWKNTQKSNKNIKGVKFSLTRILKQKYDICYRTYNKKNKWLEWTCNAEISGNKKENITAIEIKIIPKNIIKNEYLEDYDNNKNKSSIGF